MKTMKRLVSNVKHVGKAILQFLPHATAETLTLAQIASAHLFWDSAVVTNTRTFGQIWEVIITRDKVTSMMRKH